MANVAASRVALMAMATENQLAAIRHHHPLSPDVQIIVLPFHRLRKNNPSTSDLKAVHPLLAMRRLLIILVKGPSHIQRIIVLLKIISPTVLLLITGMKKQMEHLHLQL